MTSRVATIDRRDERRRGRRRPPGAHPRQPGRPEPSGRGAVCEEASASVERLVRAAEADLIARWRQARRGRLPAQAAALAGFLLDANETIARRGAARYRTGRLAQADLTQAAGVGVLRAMESFDPSAGPFGIYASYWVRKEVQRALAQGEFAVAVPAHLGGRALAVAGWSRAESHEELGERLGVGASVAAGLARLVPAAELSENEPERGDRADEWATAWAIRDALRRLPDELRRVVVARFGFDGGEARSGRQVAGELGLSEFTVRSRLRRALAALGRYLGD